MDVAYYTSQCSLQERRTVPKGCNTRYKHRRRSGVDLIFVTLGILITVGQFNQALEALLYKILLQRIWGEFAWQAVLDRQMQCSSAILLNKP